MAKKQNKIKIIPLGGLQEIGKNMTAIEYKDEMIVIDCGLSFPEDEMLGIDVVIPDVSYLVKNHDKLKGIFLTHGHEDHIGAIPYVLRKLDVPIYGTKFTLALVEHKLKENRISNAMLIEVPAGTSVKAGLFKIDYIRVTHSIPDSCALAVHTPLGVIYHSGDFKIDHTPIDNEVTDFHKMAEIGARGCLLMLAESTNVEREGYTKSEKVVGKTLDEIFLGAQGNRVIIATFASNIHRVQQIVDMSIKYGRKVAVSGRSMVNGINIALSLGYLRIPKKTLVDINDIHKYSKDSLTIITTGSQGEPMAALSRIAASEHKKIQVSEGDTVVLSAHPIPGNEKSVAKVVNQLFERGANIVYDGESDIHVSGHAKREELKLIHRIIKPKFFMPVHGEYRHLYIHGELAQELGMPAENVVLMKNGAVLEVSRNECQINGQVPSGNVLVDGLGVGDVGNIVLRDRKHLSEDGLMVVVVNLSKQDGSMVSEPDIISRGFVYVREAEGLMDEAKEIIKQTLIRNQQKNNREWAYIKTSIKEDLKSYLFQKTKRSPMILPIIMEV
ncbi:ribonuclease J [Filifactor alocis]|uniref:ribonuclease J n=1 Tax=Filifactor alocis TaxID=143361 RepID=UPI002352AFE7